MKSMRKNSSDTKISLMENEEGSSSIFLMLVLASMITLTFAVVAAADRIAVVGYSDNVLGLAGRSVMSEFHKGLKEEYGLFAFPGSPGVIRDKLNYYAGYTLNNNEKTSFENVEVDVSGNIMTDTDVFAEEVTEYVGYAMAEGLMEKTGSPEKKGEGKEVTDFDGKNGSSELKNRNIINSLPSREVEGGGSLWQKVQVLARGGWKEMLKGTGENLLLNYYILDKFKNAQDRSLDRDTFFKCEAEYILKGKLGDKENYSAFRKDLILLRNAINLAHIYTDPVKRAELAAVAAMITVPPVSAAAELVLAEIWALAEAENDVRLLEHGEKVPMLKDKASWALSAENVLIKEKKDYISMNNRTGLTYQGYLQLFLLVCDRTEKLMRMMDLIQINMKGNYNGEFLMKEMNRGFRFKGVVNGREYEYEERY